MTMHQNIPQGLLNIHSLVAVRGIPITTPEMESGHLYSLLSSVGDVDVQSDGFQSWSHVKIMNNWNAQGIYRSQDHGLGQLNQNFWLGRSCSLKNSTWESKVGHSG